MAREACFSLKPKFERRIPSFCNSSSEVRSKQCSLVCIFIQNNLYFCKDGSESQKDGHPAYG